MIKRNQLNLFLQYILAFLIILETRSVYSRCVVDHIDEIIIGGIILTIILIILVNMNYKLKTKSLFFLLFYYIYMFIFLIINVDGYKVNFVTIFMILFPLVFLMLNLYDSKEIKNLFKAYVNIMVIISAISLFFYIFGSLTGMVSTNVIQEINWGGDYGGNKIINGYFGLHFNTQTTVIFGNTILRNTSIFVEGPMFALHLLFAMALSLFMNKKLINKYSIIFGFSILSSLSITAILFYMFLLFYKYTFYNKSKTKIILLPILFFIFLIIGTTFFNDKQSTNSYNIRNDDYTASFRVFNDYPIFGSGFANNNIVIKYMSKFRLYNTGLSNSFVVLLVQGGLYLVIFYLLPVILNSLNLIKSKNKNLFLIEIMLLQLYLFFMNAYQYTSLMIIFLAFDYYILLFYNKNNDLKNFQLKEETYEKI